MERYVQAALGLALLPTATVAHAARIYIANDDMADYPWNATAADYEASMLSELDYYRGRIDATSSKPAPEQARFNADCWFYLYLYEHNRSAAEFGDLINKIKWVRLFGNGHRVAVAHLTMWRWARRPLRPRVGVLTAGTWPLA